MRVLVVPEVYRPDDLTANGTVNDALSWLDEWLDRDPTLHVYLLVPDLQTTTTEGILPNGHERVTVIEAEPPLSDLSRSDPFTETGYSSEQLRALERHIHEPNAYVDVVVDQLRSGRETLYEWLLESVEQWAAEVRPFDVVANVHDLQIPDKLRYCSYRNRFQFRLSAASAAFTDGIWFTAGVDRDSFRKEVDFLSEDVVESALSESIVAGSPVEFERFDQRYSESPQWLHLAGSFWAKKNVDHLFDVARTLHEESDIRTRLTSVDPIPDQYRRLEWVEADGEADRVTYEAALKQGDLTVHASDYETMARTPFEQAAAGQVVVLRDVPWVRECIPEEYELVGSIEELTELARLAVEEWDDAVAASRRLVAHAREVRGTTACGRRTYQDLRRRVDQKVQQYGRGKRPGIVARAADACGDDFRLDEVID